MFHLIPHSYISQEADVVADALIKNQEFFKISWVFEKLLTS